MTSLEQEIIIPNGKLLQIDSQYHGLFDLLKSYKRDFNWYFTKANWCYLNNVITNNYDSCIVGDIKLKNLPNDFIEYMYTDLKKQVFRTTNVEDVVDYFKSKTNLSWDEDESWDFNTDINFFLMNESIENLIETTISNKPYGYGNDKEDLYIFLKKKLTKSLGCLKNSELLLEYKFHTLPFYTAY